MGLTVPIGRHASADNGRIEVVLASGRRCARGVIIAAGVVYRRLEAPRIDGLLSRGVQDGSAPGEAEMYRGRRVTIVGAANSAGQAAIHTDKGTCPLPRDRGGATGMRVNFTSGQQFEFVAQAGTAP
jgi:hypothetical protein